MKISSEIENFITLSVHLEYAVAVVISVVCVEFTILFCLFDFVYLVSDNTDILYPISLSFIVPVNWCNVYAFPTIHRDWDFASE